MPPGAQQPEASCVYLSDVQRVLTLFTQGIAGRYLQLEPADEVASASWDKPRRKSVVADAEPEALLLPPSLDDFGNHRHNFGAYRIAVLHQLGFFENGTYGFTLGLARQRIPGLPDTPRGYDPLGENAPDLYRFFMLWPIPDLMRQIFTILEDLRIDAAMRRRYPGARKDLDRVLGRALAQRPEREDFTLSADLLESLVQFSLGATREDLLASQPSAHLVRMLEAAAGLQSRMATVYDGTRAAVICYRALVRAGLEEMGVAADDHGDDEILVNDERGDTSTLAPPQLKALRSRNVDFRGEMNPDFMRGDVFGGFDESLDQELGDRGGNAVGAPGEEALAHLRPELGEEMDDILAAANMQFGGHREEEDAVRSFLYDEWDYLNKNWLKGWVRLYERKLHGDDSDFIRDVRRRHSNLAFQVRRRLQFTRPDSRVRVHRVSDGEELEIDGLIEAVIDRRAGHATDERLYMRRDPALRDVAAAFLLDMSGSTGIAVPSGYFAETAMPRLRRGKYVPPPTRRSVIDVAKESLALMCDALQTLGDTYAIYGFSGEGRDKVDFYVAKTFESRLSQRTWGALAAMQPQRSTRMGPAIRHALAKLRLQPSRMKVLMIISDGYPQDKDYGPNPEDGEYGIQDTAEALREAEREGVQTFCITIDPAGYDYLRRMCEHDRYLVIDEVSDLPDQLAKVYRKLTL